MLRANRRAFGTLVRRELASALREKFHIFSPNAVQREALGAAGLPETVDGVLQGAGWSTPCLTNHDGYIACYPDLGGIYCCLGRGWDPSEFL